jgi:sRNA-binding regulator protein Hfq
MDKQVREKTPMVFVTYDGDVAGVVAKRLVYDLDVLAGEEKVRINKLQIKFCYKQQDAEIVAKHLQHSEAVRAQSLPPIKPRKERFEIDSRQLAHARQKRLPIRVVLRGGEMFTGMIDWYSYYEIKMSLGEDEASVVVFRHAAHAFEVIGGARRDAGPYRPRPSPRSDTR